MPFIEDDNAMIKCDYDAFYSGEMIREGLVIEGSEDAIAEEPPVTLIGAPAAPTGPMASPVTLPLRGWDFVDRDCPR